MTRINKMKKGSVMIKEIKTTKQSISEKFKNITYDQESYFQRTKDFVILFSFILGAALISTIVMDLILFPITLFSVKNAELYTKIFKISTVFLIAGLLLYGGILKFISYKKRGLKTIEILLYTFYNRTLSFFFLIIIILIILIFTAIIIFLLNYNYKFLYEIIN